MPTTKKRDTRKQWLKALDDLEADARKVFPEHAGKLGQLEFHLTTARMVVNDLHDTTPPTTP